MTFPQTNEPVLPAEQGLREPIEGNERFMRGEARCPGSQQFVDKADFDELA